VSAPANMPLASIWPMWSVRSRLNEPARSPHHMLSHGPPCTFMQRACVVRVRGRNYSGAGRRVHRHVFPPEMLSKASPSIGHEWPRSASAAARTSSLKRSRCGAICGPTSPHKAPGASLRSKITSPNMQRFIVGIRRLTASSYRGMRYGRNRPDSCQLHFHATPLPDQRLWCQSCTTSRKPSNARRCVCDPHLTEAPGSSLIHDSLILSWLVALAQ
jgi:hypothetical protein